MIGMDCINQQTAQDRDCSHCIWHTDGRCASWDCEYISRKEALKAVEKVKNATPMVLPPEQPEIVRCKDCKYQNKGENESESWNYCGYRPWSYVTVTDNHYCGYAERRTDD